MGADIPVKGSGGSRGDDELLAEARKGDAEALEALLVRYQPHLYRFGLRMCGNVDDASDVTQESLMAMASMVRDFRGDASVTSWLYTIIRRLCIRKRRRSKFAPASRRITRCTRQYSRPAPRRSDAWSANKPPQVVRLRRPSRWPSITSTQDSGRCSYCGTSKVYRPSRLPKSSRSASMPSRVDCTAHESLCVSKLLHSLVLGNRLHRRRRNAPTS